MPLEISPSRCPAVYHPSLNLFARVTPATLNLYATSKESISLVGDAVEKWGLIPLEPDVTSVLITLVPALTQTLLESERSSSPFSMVENSSYQQNKNWLRKVESLNTTFSTLWPPTIGLSHVGIILAVARRVLSEDYNFSKSCPLRGS